MLLVLLSFHTKAWYTFQLQLQKQIPNQELESVVLVSSCYIANYSKIQWLETNKNYYLAAPVSQEFGSGLAQELWLGVCRKFTVMMLAGVAVILKVDWIRRNHFQQGSCTWLLVGPIVSLTNCWLIGTSSLSHGLSIGQLSTWLLTSLKMSE